MLEIVREKIREVPSITNVDYSARIKTVDQYCN